MTRYKRRRKWQFADYMSPYRTKHKHALQISRRGDGQYPWPKERIPVRQV